MKALFEPEAKGRKNHLKQLFGLENFSILNDKQLEPLNTVAGRKSKSNEKSFFSSFVLYFETALKRKFRLMLFDAHRSKETLKLWRWLLAEEKTYKLQCCKKFIRSAFLLSFLSQRCRLQFPFCDNIAVLHKKNANVIIIQNKPRQPQFHYSSIYLSSINQKLYCI